MRNVFIIPSVYVRSCIVLGQSIVQLSHMIDHVLLFVKQCHHWVFVMVSHILSVAILKQVRYQKQRMGI